MAVADYDFVIGLVLKSEGGYSNNPKDAGGPTNFGITIKDYAAFMGRAVTADEVRLMPKSHALAIYKIKYNKGIAFEALRAGPDYCFLDYGINSGLARPPRVAATLLRRPLVSRMTADMVKAINDADPNRLIDATCDERLHFMKGIRGGTDWQEFGRGWTTRVASVRAISHRLAKGDGTAFPKSAEIHTESMAKAVIPKNPKVVKSIQGSTAAGSVAGGSTGTSSIGLAVACVVTVVVIGGIAYYFYSRSVKKANERVELPPGMVPIAA